MKFLKENWVPILFIACLVFVLVNVVMAGARAAKKQEAQRLQKYEECKVKTQGEIEWCLKTIKPTL